MRRIPKFQVSIGHILFAVLVVAIIFAEYTQPHWRTAAHFTTLACIEILVILACVEALVWNIPAPIADAQNRNCHRRDGTWSDRRERIERNALRKLRRELWKAFLLVALVANVAATFVHFEVIPIPLALDSMASFSPVEEEWRDNLKDEELEFGRWAGVAANSDAFNEKKRLLFRSWPVILIAAIALGITAFGFVGNCFAHALRRLSSSVKYRSQQYRLIELHEAVGNDEFAKAKRRRTTQRKSHA